MRGLNQIAEFRKQVLWGAAILTFLVFGAAPLWAQIVVTNTNDSGPGSLRQAIIDARDGGPTAITFDPNILPATINVTSPLPRLTDAGDAIDGTGQVTIQGVGLTTTSDHGLRINASNINISGLTIQNFGGDGIRVQPNPLAPSSGSNQTVTGIVISNNRVQKNRNGIHVLGGETSNQIGATIINNILVQNDGDGIVVAGSNDTGNGGNVTDVVIRGNDINASSGNTSPLAGDGIVIVGGQGINDGTNSIRAVISDNLSRNNADEGIRIAGAGTGSRSSNNQIGVTITGNITRANGDPNGGNGITITGGPTPRFPASTSQNQITFLVDGNTSYDNKGAAPAGNGISVRGNEGSDHMVTGTISNNIFKGNEGAGIQLLGRGSTNTLSDIVVRANVASANGLQGLIIFGGDSPTTNTTISNVLVTENSFDKNGSDGISANLGTGPGNSISFAAITDNVMRQNTGDGIFIPVGVDGAPTDIIGNVANQSSGGDGIDIEAAGYFLSENIANGNSMGAGITALGNNHDFTNTATRNASCNTPGCF